MILRRFFGNGEREEEVTRAAEDAEQKVEAERIHEFVEQNFPELEKLTYPGSKETYSSEFLQRIRSDPETWNNAYEDIYAYLEQSGGKVRERLKVLLPKEDLTEEEESELTQIRHLSVEATDREVGIMIDLAEKVRQFVSAGIFSEDTFYLKSKLIDPENLRLYHGEVKEGFRYQLNAEQLREFLAQLPAQRNPERPLLDQSPGYRKADKVIYKMQALERDRTSPFKSARNPKGYQLAREHILQFFPSRENINYGEFVNWPSAGP